MPPSLQTDPAPLPHFSIGVGDRFAHQAKPQLEACVQALRGGVTVIPVWNKSNREHTIIGSVPEETRAAADRAVSELKWTLPYFVDADHVNLSTAERFVASCDFFTIDVAEEIGQPAPDNEVRDFAAQHPELAGEVALPGTKDKLSLQSETVARSAAKYLAAARQAGRIYRHIVEKKNGKPFVTEVSVDETDSPQTPADLLVILAALADEKIPLQTIAPKFTGRFNKGVDYVGDIGRFSQEFVQDLGAIAFAVDRYGLPASLKLSVHSGSDKFSLYPVIHGIITETGAGLHLKTAGTTWLEELIGLAESGGEGLELAKEIYAEAYAHREDLCAPYRAVIDIDAAALPTPNDVRAWTSAQFVNALRHDPSNPAYNASFRQSLHVAFKVAAKMGQRYLNLLSAAEHNIASNVTTNLFERHIRPVFMGN